jgi:hypothetical protein
LFIRISGDVTGLFHEIFRKFLNGYLSAFAKQCHSSPEHIMHLADIARPGVVFKYTKDFRTDSG